MKVFSVCGPSGSGKTTTIEAVIAELVRRGYKVGSVKEIHAETFTLDPNPASNTARHRRAGAEIVTARGLRETGVLFPRKLGMEEILAFYHGFDYVVLEGVRDIAVPIVETAHSVEDLVLGDRVFCVSGKVAAGISEYRGIPARSAIPDAKPLVDLIVHMVGSCC